SKQYYNSTVPCHWRRKSSADWMVLPYQPVTKSRKRLISNPYSVRRTKAAAAEAMFELTGGMKLHGMNELM
ncbi:MAG: hypothetical protein KAV00_08570, partial [Phycisphaerae bacterium]|nr:hypothetical protein [Phycisphaerae bacterium]